MNNESWCGLVFQPQIYRAVVRMDGVLIDSSRHDAIFQVFSHRDIVYPPAFIIGPRVGPVAPP